MAIIPKKTLKQIGAGFKSVGERVTGADRNKILERIAESTKSIDENLKMNTEAQFGILEVLAENAKIALEESEDKKRESRFKPKQGSTAAGMLSSLGKRYETEPDKPKEKGKGGGILSKIFGGGLIAASGGIAAFAGGLALLGKALIPFSAGLIALGPGIAAVGAGIGVGAGIASWGLGNFFDDIDRLIEMDTEGLKENSEALASFGEAMVELGKGGVGASLGTLFSNITDSLSTFFGGDAPLDKYIPQMQKLQEANLDPVLISKNANAMKAFGEAMAAMGEGTTKTSGGLKVIGQLIGEGLLYLTGSESPMQKLESFSEKDIDPDGNIAKNTKHIIDYANAMDKLPTGETFGDSLLNLGNSVINWMSGAKSPMTKFTEFTQMEIDSKKALANINALVAFSDAMGKSKVVDETTLGPIKAIGSWISSWGDQDDFIDKLVKFGAEPVPLGNVLNNAKALKAMNEALMSSGGENVDETTSTLGPIKAIGSWISSWGNQADFIDKLKKFGAEPVPVGNVLNNAKALKAMNEALMSSGGESVDKTTLGPIKAIGSWISSWGDQDDFIDKLKKFGAEPVDIIILSNNLNALRIFRGGMSSMPPEQDEGFWSKVHDSLTAMLPDKDHISPMIRFTEKVIDVNAMKNNIEAMSMFLIGMNISDKIPEESSWDKIKNSFKGMVDWFGKDQLQVIVDQMTKFNEAFDESGIDSENFNKKTKALFGFINTFKLVPENLDKTIDRLSVLENVDFEKILKPISMFGEVELSDDISDNAKRVSAFVNAMKELSGVGVVKTSTNPPPIHNLRAERDALAKIHGLEGKSFTANITGGNLQGAQISRLNENAVERQTAAQPVVLNNTPVNNSPSNVVNNVTNNYNITSGTNNDYLQADPQHDF